LCTIDGDRNAHEREREFFSFNPILKGDIVKLNDGR